MATLQELEHSLRKAHEAGNTEHARIFAAEIMRMRQQKPEPFTPEAARENRAALWYGVRQPIDAAAQLLTRGLESGVGLVAPGTAAETWMRGQRENVERANEMARQTGQAAVARAPQGASSQVVGNIIGAVPAIAAMPATLLGSAILGGAAAGGAGAALQPVEREQQGSFWAEKGKQALTGAGVGGLVGGVAGRLAQLGQKAPPASLGVKAKARAAYQAADKAGIEIKSNSLGQLANDLRTAVKKAGTHPKLHPRALGALEAVEEAAQSNQSLQNFDILRRVVKDAASSVEPSERRIAGIMIEKLDDFAEKLGPADVTGGASPEMAVSALQKARGLWSQASKGEFVENLMQRAADRATQFSGSGYENALRTEFRQVVMNPRRMRLFTKDEQAALRRVAAGGPIGNAMRMLGKFAPRGIVSSTLSSGAGAVIGGTPGAIALPLLGEAGRAAATIGTQRNAQRALALMLQGHAIPKAAPNQWIQLLSPYLAGTAGQQTAALLNQK